MLKCQHLGKGTFLSLRPAWAIYSKIPVALGEPGKEKGWVVWMGMVPIDSCV